MSNYLDKSIGLKINKTANIINHHYINLLSKYHIAPEQRATLIILKEDKQANQVKKVANLLGKDKATICRAFNSLEKKGLIKKYEKKEDKRVNIIKLTKKGEKILDKTAPITEKFKEQLSANFDENEKKTLIEMLDKICKNVKGIS